MKHFGDITKIDGHAVPIVDNACPDYEPAADGEAWRMSDKAVDEWLGVCEEYEEETYEHTD